MSKTKTKYIALGHKTQKAIWLKWFFNKLQIKKFIFNVILLIKQYHIDKKR